MNVAAKQYQMMSQQLRYETTNFKSVSHNCNLICKGNQKECFQKNTRCLLYQLIAVFGIVKLLETGLISRIFIKFGNLGFFSFFDRSYDRYSFHDNSFHSQNFFRQVWIRFPRYNRPAENVSTSWHLSSYFIYLIK